MNSMTEFEDQLFSERMQRALHDFGPEIVLPMIQVWEASVPQRETLRLLTDDEPPLDSIDDRMHWGASGAVWDEEPYLVELEFIEAGYEMELAGVRDNEESLLAELNARHDRERRTMDLNLCGLPPVRFEELDDQWADLVLEADREWTDPFKGVVDWGNKPLSPKVIAEAINDHLKEAEQQAQKDTPGDRT